MIWFSTWRHERYVVVLVDDGARDVGVEDVEAEGEDPQLDQPVVPLRLLRRPPTDDAQGYVEDRRQALNQISTSENTRHDRRKNRHFACDFCRNLVR